MKYQIWLTATSWGYINVNTENRPKYNVRNFENHVRPKDNVFNGCQK